MNLTLLFTLLFCVLSEVPSTRSQSDLLNILKSKCHSNCADSHVFCAFTSKCENSASRLLCQRTCGVCKACSTTTGRELVPSEEFTECEVGTCVDVWNPTVCFLYEAKKLCVVTGNNCRKTCKKCKECKLPPTESPCVPESECKDEHTACKDWNSGGYCKVKGNKFPHVRTVCQKTCKVCTVCPEANTALPPIPK